MKYRKPNLVGLPLKIGVNYGTKYLERRNYKEIFPVFGAVNPREGIYSNSGRDS
jgi:hypothetical protein